MVHFPTFSSLDNEGLRLRKWPQTYLHCELDGQGNKELIISPIKFFAVRT